MVSLRPLSKFETLTKLIHFTNSQRFLTFPDSLLPYLKVG